GHAGVGSGARCDGQGVLGLRPCDGDSGVVSGFVVVVVAFVLIEAEAAVGAGVDAEFDGAVRFFSGVLLGWAEGEDRSGADVEWDSIEACGGVDVDAALYLLTGPEVEPCSIGRQVQSTFGG